MTRIEKAAILAEKAARLFGDTAIGCTHFFADYRNDMLYVIDRIRAAMG